MVEISQTETDIKIIIKIINIISKKPDIVLLPKYVKFNCPPTFFEGHLAQEIDENKSLCKIFKKEFRIILKKKVIGNWEKIFEEIPTKLDAIERRKEMATALLNKNQEKEKESIKKIDDKKKHEIHREIERDSDIRNRIDNANKIIIEEEICEDVPKNSPSKKEEKIPNKKEKVPAKEEKYIKQCPRVQLLPVRENGKIKFNFTKFGFNTPKRESQETWQTEVEMKKLQSQMQIV